MTNSQPKTSPVPGTGLRLFERKMHELLEDFPVTVSGRTFIIKAGFRSDGASVPTPFKWLLSEAAIDSIAAWLHDWLYFTGQLSKEEADATFHQALKEIDGVRRFDQQVMFWAVAFAGESAWERHRKLGHPELNREVV